MPKKSAFGMRADRVRFGVADRDPSGGRLFVPLRLLWYGVYRLRYVQETVRSIVGINLSYSEYSAIAKLDKE